MRIAVASLALGAALNIQSAFGIALPNSVEEVSEDVRSFVEDIRVGLAGGAAAAGPAAVNLFQEIPLEEWAKDKQDKALVWEFEPLEMARPRPKCGKGRGGHRDHHHKPTVSDRFRNVANKFRHLFGLPPLHKEHKHHHKHHHEHHEGPPHPPHPLPHVLPTFVESPTPQTWPYELVIIEGFQSDEAEMSRYEPFRPFMTRVHQALMTLGPWESRFVAFVFGCGIGALIRMFAVLFIVAFRGARGRRCQRRGIFLADEVAPAGVENAAPPAYVADVKVPLDTEKAVQIEEGALPAENNQ